MSEVESKREGKSVAVELMMLALREIKAPPPMLLPKGVLKPRPQ